MNQPLIQPNTSHLSEQEAAIVEQVFAGAQEMLGMIPEPLRLMSISPPVLQSFASNVMYFRGHARISPVLSALIRYITSERAQCKFCIDFNEGMLVQHLGIDLDAVRATRDDLDQAPLSDKEKVLLRIAIQSVTDATQVSAADMEMAHAAGWSDRDVFDACAMAASNRMLNHLLKTFNVEEQGSFA